MILTDLSSLNGTSVNRAKLRPHADSQIQAQDVIAFGSSDATFQLVALDASESRLPSALDTAEAMMGGEWHMSDRKESEPASTERSDRQPDLSSDLLSQWDSHAAHYWEASSRAEQCKHLLQVNALANTAANEIHTVCTAVSGLRWVG